MKNQTWIILGVITILIVVIYMYFKSNAAAVKKLPAKTTTVPGVSKLGTAQKPVQPSADDYGVYFPLQPGDSNKYTQLLQQGIIDNYGTDFLAKVTGAWDDDTDTALSEIFGKQMTEIDLKDYDTVCNIYTDGTAAV